MNKIIKTEVWDCPTLTAPGFNRPGGLTKVLYRESTPNVADIVTVIQELPNPASTSLPFIQIHCANLTVADFDAFIRPSFAALGATLVSSK